MSALDNGSDRSYTLNSSIKVIICDIEGTTTSIDFVKDVLFPHVRANVKEYLENNFDNLACKEDVNLLVLQSQKDASTFPDQSVPVINENLENKSDFIASILDNIYWQMDLDKKSTALKQLQGHIWKDAYERGIIAGHVYDDVLKAFQNWTNNGIKVYIYSSGSVQAQKLLFSYSKFGDLTRFLSGHYDTNVGAKQNRESYERILKDIGIEANESLFLTDMIPEAIAARDAGLNVCVVRREDNANKQIDNFEWIENFSQII